MQSSEGEETISRAAAAAADGTRSRLHNFSFPTLSWGNHRLYRCSRPAAGEPRNSACKHGSPPPPLPPSGRKDDSVTVEEAVITVARPWNLRTRRAASNAPAPPTPPPPLAENRQRNSSSSSLSLSPSPVRGNSAVRRRSESLEKEKREPRKFTVALSKQEIEEDFLVLKGSKPPRRPKKRSRFVQRQLDSLFPGLWLTGVTPETYKLQDV